MNLTPSIIFEVKKELNHQKDWLTNFGQRLKSERERQNMTQQTLAIKANTKQDYIAQIERGARNPSLRTLINILSALDISADYLIYGYDSNYDSNKNNNSEMIIL